MGRQGLRKLVVERLDTRCLLAADLLSADLGGCEPALSTPLVEVATAELAVGPIQEGVVTEFLDAATLDLLAAASADVAVDHGPQVEVPEGEATLTLTQFNVVETPYHYWHIYGTVSYSGSMNDVTVSLWGVATVTLAPNAAGEFEINVGSSHGPESAQAYTTTLTSNTLTVNW